MSATGQLVQEPLLVDVELVSVAGGSGVVQQQQQYIVATTEGLHCDRSHLNGVPIRSYQSTAATRGRTLSGNSDDSSLLPDIGYSSGQSTHLFFAVHFL